MRWPIFFKAEKRATIEDPSVSISDRAILAFLGMDNGSDGETVSIEKALGIPAIWAAVNFLSGTMAGLPLNVYRKGKDGRVKVQNGIGPILHDAVNDELSSFDWRKHVFDQILTEGRSISFIERNKSGKVINLWPLDMKLITIKRANGQKVYNYKDGQRTVHYEASEVIDLAYMFKGDLLSHRSPIFTNKTTISLALSVTKYGSKFFANGGVPPFAIEGPFESPAGMQRAGDQLHEAVKKAAKENRLALAMPAGHTIKKIGADPEKSQMVEVKRFLIEEIARIYSLPPTFLQDLTHGTFSNTEQQDLHLVKHTVKRWAEQFEQELNLKLFGRGNNKTYVELNMDGLLRGDFKTRMEGTSKAVQSGLLTPNEGRKMDNRPNESGGDKLYMQGAMVPITETGAGDNNA